MLIQGRFCVIYVRLKSTTPVVDIGGTVVALVTVGVSALGVVDMHSCLHSAANVNDMACT